MTIAQAETHGCRMQTALTAEHLTACFYKADVTHHVVLAQQQRPPKWRGPFNQPRPFRDAGPIAGVKFPITAPLSLAVVKPVCCMTSSSLLRTRVNIVLCVGLSLWSLSTQTHTQRQRLRWPACRANAEGKSTSHDYLTPGLQELSYLIH